MTIFKKSKIKAVLYFCSVFYLFIAGCASTHIAVKKDVPLSKYKKIYLVNFEEDTRKVLPKVQEHLAQLGYEVILTNQDEPVGGIQGTGFIISPEGHILTAAHVLGKQKEATIRLSGRRYEADVIYADQRNSEDDEKTKELLKSKNIETAMNAALNSQQNQSIFDQINEIDLALLKIRTEKEIFPPLIISSDPPYKMGQEVYTIGFPLSDVLGDQPRLNKGLISSTVGMKDHPDFLQVSVEIQPGNSGGPLLDHEGRVIGLIQSTINPMMVLANTGGNLPQNVNFAMKNNRIKEFLRKSSEDSPFSVKKDGSMPFDEVQHSIVKIRSGIIPSGFEEEPKLVCAVSYASFWDMWYRFSVLDILFYDLDTQEILLRAGQFGDNPFSTENSVLEKTFKEIEKKLANL